MRKLLSENPQEALRILLRRINVPHTDQTIRQLEAHPDFPSLLSMNYTLDQLGVENVALRPDYLQMRDELPKPLLVAVKDNGGMYMVLEGFDENEVHFVNEKGKLESQPKDHFLHSWTGIALAVNPDIPAKEVNFRQNQWKTRINKARVPFILLVLGFILVSLILYNWSNYNIWSALFLLTNGLGIAVCVPLLLQSFNKEHLLVKRFCSSKKKESKVNCSSILDSSAARFLGLFSWSEIGFLYFLSLWIILLAMPVSGTFINTYFAIAAIPYAFYSIYYQGIIAKSWCRLCLWVQLVLGLEFAIALSHLLVENSLGFQWEASFFPALLAGAVIAAFLLIRPLWEAWENNKYEVPALRRMKYKEEVFNLFHQQMPAVRREMVEPLILKNAGEQHILTLITNPSCAPCIEMHKELFQLLQNKQETTVEEIFITKEGPGSISYQIVQAMMHLRKQVDDAEFKAAIQDYYMNFSRNFNAWKEKYQIPELLADAEKESIDAHNFWCSLHNLGKTPIVVYNGKYLPERYTLKDLAYILS